MIKIGLNIELDYQVYAEFRNFSVSGVDFGLRIKKDHPHINLENYKKYIDEFYKENRAEIEISISELSGIINQKSDLYFTAIKKYFGLDCGKENYKGYVSIFDCNPRFVDDKSFQVFYKKSGSDKLRVCFHEITHFAFFDYFEKLFPAEYRSLDRNSGVLWELSEVINVILLNEPEFKNILQGEEKLFYPNLEDKLTAIRSIWGGSGKRLDTNFIQKSLAYLAY
ncbi:hypothetical protein A3H04_02060 [Candidatus Giovannonibacteria bacterium RIFCSPLOWO2_12_FULL_43_11c]|uniref:DUF1570 domain-containing protein n=1 Tax=Candidatus Giovannonibacteria bacterium RIFCSPHIGHO2_12_FULL_43_15 TaxID=1798341 RepID=A0A1F5WNQ0_9BACT|nr:MAG: hypothetical protein A3B97_00010 [Candidatus Giovannonibacteria bacterium RIFCSPHIGHO2_02_FULL_43_32]OGF77276.1 MAG: hypothetical protein A3F23_01955 [Candidatus Giovannonibacteria bacterium RIFCSPHIGHO2_12_FULL_43_15]OGF91494.1 MAG: hypothetical protein A3H04_02060 [Candidatus Giovannonibacteria bacterium RIFCSPLOWO2_12_FULL_43_11c]